jgi:hypothetical protein
MNHRMKLVLHYFLMILIHSFRSSTIRILNVKIQTFENCLYLLDGRFNQLHTLTVHLSNVHRPDKILNQVSFIKQNKKRYIFFFLG